MRVRGKRKVQNPEEGYTAQSFIHSLQYLGFFQALVTKTTLVYEMSTTGRFQNHAKKKERIEYGH